MNDENMTIRNMKENNNLDVIIEHLRTSGARPTAPTSYGYENKTSLTSGQSNLCKEGGVIDFEY